MLSGTFTEGLNLQSSDATVRGLAIHGFRENIRAGSTAIIVGNYLGTDGTGTAAPGNTFGVVVSGDGVTVGGIDTDDRNVISGNHTGVDVLGDNALIIGNFIGTDPSGSVAVPNRVRGIRVRGNDAGIGVNGSGNLISGNGTFRSASAVEVDRATGTRVASNRIGTTADGAAAVAQYWNGHPCCLKSHGHNWRFCFRRRQCRFRHR